MVLVEYLNYVMVFAGNTTKVYNCCMGKGQSCKWRFRYGLRNCTGKQTLLGNHRVDRHIKLF
jgi:hypothetical protein